MKQQQSAHMSSTSREKLSGDSAGNQTHNLLIMRPTLYHCAHPICVQGVAKHEFHQKTSPHHQVIKAQFLSVDTPNCVCQFWKVWETYFLGVLAKLWCICHKKTTPRIWQVACQLQALDTSMSYISQSSSNCLNQSSASLQILHDRKKCSSIYFGTPCTDCTSLT
jgi:hypothetical protein